MSATHLLHKVLVVNGLLVTLKPYQEPRNYRQKLSVVVKVSMPMIP